MVNSGTIVRPSSMLTTAVMVGLSAGDGLMHNKATLIIIIASSLLNSDPNYGSTNSIKFPFLLQNYGLKWKKKKVLEVNKNQKEEKKLIPSSILMLFLKWAWSI